MPLSDTYVRLPIELIHVKRDERQRREIETEDLQRSIKQVGLINPIVVREQGGGLFELVAGERRLEAFKALKMAEIPARFAHELTHIESNIIELEENVKRKELPWQDMVKAVVKLHDLHIKLDKKWTQANTAEALSIAEGTMSMYFKVGNHIHDPRIAECSTVRQAYEVIDRREKRGKAVELAGLFDEDYDDDDWDDDEEYGEGEVEDPTAENVIPLLGGPRIATPTSTATSVEGGEAPLIRRMRPIADDIIHADFLEWAPQYSGRKYNFIHVDFPYGTTEIGPQHLGNEHTMYEDNPRLYMQLLGCFCENLNNFFADFGWCMFWYSERMGRVTRDFFKFNAPSLNVQTHALIWVHSDNAGISPDVKRRPRHIYDTALLMSRGEMPLVKVKSDAYASPTDHKLHPSTKPVPMLKHFFEMFVDEHTTILDPTCGSGAALRAAETLGARRVLGLEADWNHCETARKALIDDRKLRNLWEAS